MEARKISRRFLVIAMCLVSTFFGFLGLGDIAVQAQDDVIKFGLATSITGPAAAWGVGPKKGAELAISQINARGGIRGKKLMLVVRDSEHKPEKAVLQVRELAEREKVVGFLGCSNSASMLAVTPIFNNELKVPLICPATDAQEITDNEAWSKGEPNYLYRWGMYGDGQSQVLVLMATDPSKLGYKRVALLTWTGGWGVTGRRQLLKRLEEIGLKAVADETYDLGDTDMTPQLLKIRKAKAEVILNYGLEDDNARVMRSRAKIGDKTPYISAWAIASSAFWNAARELGEGVMVTTFFTPHGPQPQKVKEFMAEYIKMWGDNFEAMPATFAGYDIMNIFAQVIEKVGTDPKAIRDGLENVTEFDGLMKEFNRPVFTKERHNALIWNEDFFLTRWTNGELLRVYFDEKEPYVMPQTYIDRKTAALK